MKTFFCFLPCCLFSHDDNHLLFLFFFFFLYHDRTFPAPSSPFPLFLSLFSPLVLSHTVAFYSRAAELEKHVPNIVPILERHLVNVEPHLDEIMEQVRW